MFKLLVPIPKKLFVAVSGGIDSMVALDFCMLMQKDVTVLHFNHGTVFGNKAEEFVQIYCDAKKIPLIVGRISNDVKFNGKSKEDVWRKERYKFFKEATTEKDSILMAHHLNDAIETWIFTSLNGNPFLIPVRRDNFIRPLLISDKKEILSWSDRKKVPCIEDPSNNDISYARNLIRHKIMPDALKVNPGISKVIRKKYLQELN